MQSLSGPVLRDTARLSQRYPPIARSGVRDKGGGYLALSLSVQGFSLVLRGQNNNWWFRFHRKTKEKKMCGLLVVVDGDDL